MADIVGIYSNQPESDWSPITLQVNMGDTGLDGEYKNIGHGGGGLIYLNSETDTVIKVKFFTYSEDKEFVYQKQVGDIAPLIFYDGFRKIESDRGGHSFGGDTMQIVIMEYLNPDEWIPLRGEARIGQNITQIFEVIDTLIFELNLKNIVDFVGNTGPHLFLNDITGKIKIIDYGFYTESTNHHYDFMMMVKEIQDKYISWPDDEELECYKKLMNLEEDLSDESCNGLVLYEGRKFLEAKRGPQLRRSTRSSRQPTRYKPSYGARTIKTRGIQKTRRGQKVGGSKRKKTKNKSKRKKSKRKKSKRK